MCRTWCDTFLLGVSGIVLCGLAQHIAKLEHRLSDALGVIGYQANGIGAPDEAAEFQRRVTEPGATAARPAPTTRGTYRRPHCSTSR
jgi:hypothetical protein